MKKTVLALVVALASAGSALSEEAPGPVLWEGIRAGMPYLEAEALYPRQVPDPNRPGRMKRTGVTYFHDHITVLVVPITSRCRGDLAIYHDHRAVYSVEVSKDSECPNEAVFGALVARYGQPDASVAKTVSDPVFGNHESVESRWTRDGVVITNIDQTTTFTATDTFR